MAPPTYRPRAARGLRARPWSAAWGFGLRVETRADHFLKSPYYFFWHLVTTCEVMRRKQEYLLNAGFLPCLQEALCTTFWRTE